MATYNDNRTPGGDGSNVGMLLVVVLLIVLVVWGIMYFMGGQRPVATPATSGGTTSVINNDRAATPTVPSINLNVNSVLPSTNTNR